MTVAELLTQLQAAVDAGQGEAIVTVFDDLTTVSALDIFEDGKVMLW